MPELRVYKETVVQHNDIVLPDKDPKKDWEAYKMFHELETASKSPTEDNPTVGIRAKEDNPERDRYKDRSVTPSETDFLQWKKDRKHGDGIKWEVNAHEIHFIDSQGITRDSGFSRSQAPTRIGMRNFFSWILDKSPDTEGEAAKKGYILNLVQEKDKGTKYDDYTSGTTFEKSGKKKEMTVTPGEMVANEKLGVTTTELEVKKGSKRKTVVAEQYGAWPDHGTVTVDELSKLVDHVIEMKESHDPVVIHCSAGAGRTGTLIVASIMKEMIENAKEGRLQINKENYKDELYQVILSIRQHSIPGFVQTEEQLKLIFDYCEKLLKESQK